MSSALLRAVGLTAALGASASAASAQAADGPLPGKFELVLGGYFGSLSTVLQLDGSAGARGTEVVLERDLGSPDRDKALRGSATARFGRHQVRVGYFRMVRESTTTLARTIDWGDRHFDVGADVSTYFRSEFPELDYSYWFVSNRRLAVGGSLGVTLFGLQTGVDLAGSAGARAVSRQVDTRTPVPLLGFEARVQATPWLRGRANAGYIGDFSGSRVWTAGIALEPRIAKALWAGISYDGVKFNVSGSGPFNFIEGQGSYRVRGVQAYGRLVF